MGTNLEETRRLVTQRLEGLQRAGVGQIGKATVTPEFEPPACEETAPPASPVGAASTDPGPPLPIQAAPDQGGSPVDSLRILQAEVTHCTLCSELATTRRQTVFGVGNPESRLCFLGEAPGADEDRQGEPFVGQAGKLLNRIIEACQMKREEVYILNVLKCRPPANRNPHPEEAANCRPFLDRQLKILQPEFICCLGSVAAQNLLDTTTSISQLRGTFHPYGSIQVLCTYHPAYLLRNPSAKALVWEDMKMLMRQWESTGKRLVRSLVARIQPRSTLPVATITGK